jgi:hypothetical protein
MKGFVTKLGILVPYQQNIRVPPELELRLVQNL